ncbi:helix-turn-helix transcriptional regulator [Vibrio sp.]|nr:helix-turn-helix transcriptional regulator [Vibrio sp.]
MLNRKAIILHGEQISVSDEFHEWKNDKKYKMVHLSMMSSDGWSYGRDVTLEELSSLLSNEDESKRFINNCKMALGLNVSLVCRLTKQELNILQYMSDGLTNQEIANTLVRSLATVKTHVSSILKKLGAKNRRHALQIAMHKYGLGEEA